ncbi:MAG TPA: Tm-1-like ATP-binding domain-containing protein [Thermodesulfobacteriota bacterium]|nr:Tm-1-like ATP-binding domain-containing protein [Thermodesulfobacteriota bacterium]
MQKKLLIIATLDTKGREVAYVRDCVQRLGIHTVVMDVGILGEPLTHPDISREEVVEASGYRLEQLVNDKNRSVAVKAVQEGGTILAKQLLEQGRLDGVFGMGGGTGTAIVTHMMRSLPYGLPKVVLSTVASRDVREYIGTKDIVMFHSVADILGSNEFLRLILEQASFAIWAMMEKGRAIRKEKAMVAVTAYGINSACAIQAEPLLQERGYEMIAFHANGCGGMAMEEFIAEGLVAGVLDFTPHEIADEMFGGYCRGIGPTRFETAGRMGIPLVLAPGGLDNAVFSPFYPMPDRLKGRKIHTHDTRFCVRMKSEEMKEFAKIIGEKLNKSKGPAYVLIPKKGWSEADKEGMELFDPETDQIFVEELRKILNPHILIEEMDVHISDSAFGSRAVAILDHMIQTKGTGFKASG